MPSRDPDRRGRRNSLGRSAQWPGSSAIIAFTGILLMALNLRSAVTAVPPLLDQISADPGLTP